MDERGDGQAEPRAVQPRLVAADETRLLEPAVPAQALRGREAGRLGQLEVAGARMALQVVEDELGLVVMDRLRGAGPLP